MRTKHLLKRIFAMVMILAVIVSLCPFKSAEVQAKSGKAGMDVWGQKYIDYILNHQFDYLNNESEPPYLYEQMTYELIYIDDDNIPEILYSGVDEVTGMGVIYINSDGDVDYQQFYRHGFGYIEYEGLVINNTGNTGYYFTDIYSFKNGHFDKIGSGNYSERLDENGRYTGEFDYKWEEKNVSEEEYKKKVDKLFDGSKSTPINNNGYSLQNDYSDIVLKILTKSLIYSDTPWIRAYQDFLVNKKYLDIGQDYGNEAKIIGKLFDMDHDGIPELILDNGYTGRAMRAGYIYTYDNGVKFLDNGPSEAYVDYDEGYAGSLYGLYAEVDFENFFWEYHKKGNEISSELIEHYTDVTNDSPIYKSYRYIAKSEMWILIHELSFYDALEKEKMTNPAGDVADLHDLLGGLGWYRGNYDYRSINADNISSMFLLYVMKNLKKYPGGVIERDYYDYSKNEKDPKNKFNYGYLRYNGDDLDWVFKNIYNVGDSIVEELHKKDNSDLYYYNQKYYSGTGGVGGGYSAYLDEIENLGGVYQITYHQIIIPDGPTNVNYKTKYALAAYKKIDGKGYWSIYKVADKPLYDEADLIDLGFQLSDKYKPYPIVALKSRSTGKYVTCDIGVTDNEGKYKKINNPDYTVNADKVNAYEMFYLIPLSDGHIALQTIMSKKYMSISDGVTVSDFAQGGAILNFYGDSNVGYFYSLGRWVGRFEDYLVSVENKGLAEAFEVVLIDKNEYSDQEKNILSSGEWFNIDDAGVGYWDIQREIGLTKEDKYNKNSEENVRALKKLGYTLMYRKDLNHNSNTRTIEYDNMQCAIGVKKTDGIYDVIIAFQGTCGYWDKTSSNDSDDAMYNLMNGRRQRYISYQGKQMCLFCHPGYHSMSIKLVDNNKIENWDKHTMAYIGNDEISLNELIELARKGRAKFTLLGHSMGGAIAQCYALYLVGCGISPSSIRGRTFNSALALADENACDLFTDWYNLCVISDSVPRGLVPGSYMEYGMHRLGKTIWLYDNKPDNNLEFSFIDNFTNITGEKHNMDKVVYDILKEATASAYKGYQDVGANDIFVTNKKNVPVYDRPKKDSDPSSYIDGIHTVVEIESYSYNDVGNKWYKTKDGKFIYSGNLEVLKKQSIGWSMLPDFIIASDKAPLRVGCYNDTEVIEKVKKDTAIEVDYAVKNGGGNVWYHTTVNGNTGWIYSAHVQRGISQKRIADGIKWLLAIDCPVNVSLYTSDDELAASIIDGEVFTTDKKAINPYVIGDGKYFEVYDDEQYYVEIDSLSDGMMDYTIYSDYDTKTGEFKEIKKFEAVDLSEEQYFDSIVSGDISTEDVELRVVDEDGQIISVIGTDGMPVKDTGFFNKKNIIIVGASAAGLVMFTSIVLICRKKRKKSKEKKAA